MAEDKVEEEIGKFAAAMAATLKQLDTIRQKALDEMGPEEAAIFEAHMQIAQDPSLSDGIKSLVESSHTNVVAAKMCIRDSRNARAIKIPPPITNGNM